MDFGGLMNFDFGLDPDFLDWLAQFGDLNLNFDPALISEPPGSVAMASSGMNVDPYDPYGDQGYDPRLVDEPSAGFQPDPYDPNASYTGTGSSGSSSGASGASGALGQLLKAVGGLAGGGGDGSGGGLGIGIGGASLPSSPGYPNLPLPGGAAGISSASGITVPEMSSPAMAMSNMQLMQIPEMAPSQTMVPTPLELGGFTPMTANVPLPQQQPQGLGGLARLLGIR